MAVGISNCHRLANPVVIVINIKFPSAVDKGRIGDHRAGDVLGLGPLRSGFALPPLPQPQDITSPV